MESAVPIGLAVFAVVALLGLVSAFRRARKPRRRPPEFDERRR